MWKSAFLRACEICTREDFRFVRRSICCANVPSLQPTRLQLSLCFTGDSFYDGLPVQATPIFVPVQAALLFLAWFAPTSGFGLILRAHHVIMAWQCTRGYLCGDCIPALVAARRKFFMVASSIAVFYRGQIYGE